MHSRSSVLTPSRSPRSTSSRLTQSNSVCGVELIIGAIDSAAAHIDGCSLGCSRTKRIARSRTSGENLLGFLFMARFSRESEPPQNPVWSTSHLRRDDMTIKHFIGTVHRRTVARTFKPRHEVAPHGSYPNSKRRRTSLKRFTMRKSRVHRRSAFVLRSITAGESLLEYKGANHMTNCNPGALPQWHRRAYVLLRPIQRPRHRRQHWR